MVCGCRRGGAHGDSGKVSRGTAVITDKTIGAAWCNGHSTADFSPPDMPGRLSATWTHGIVRGGMVMISIYLFDSEGMSERNRKLLDTAGDLIASLGLPWALMGDFNMTPEELFVDR